jgi:hypothetical protein
MNADSLTKKKSLMSEKNEEVNARGMKKTRSVKKSFSEKNNPWWMRRKSYRLGIM